MSKCLLRDCPAARLAYHCITLYAVPDREEKGQATLLLCRRKRTRRWPAAHCSPGVPRQRREGCRAGQGPHCVAPFGGHRPRLRFARFALAGGPAHRRLRTAPVAVASIAL